MVDRRRELVRHAYDATAPAFAAVRRHGPERRWLEAVTSSLRAGAAVLDLGSGSGMPIAAALVRAGFTVTGVDFSAEQVRGATARVPGARFIVGDMLEVELPVHSFAAVLAWDSIFHLPAEQQPQMFARVHRWLEPGGAFLLTLGGTGGELYVEHLGVPMYYAALPPEQALDELQAAGFELLARELDDASGGGHLVVLARA